MKIIIIALIIISNHILISQNIWEISLGNQDNKFKSINCPDSTNIYLITTKLSIIGKMFLYKSSNQGINWSLINTLDSVDFENLSCPSSSNIWLGFEGGFAFNSTDGGESFSLKTIDGVKSYEQIEMYDNDVGVISNAYIVPDTFFILITKDSWKTYKKFSLQNDSNRLSYKFPKFKNDSIVTCIVGNSRGTKGKYFFELNINTLEYKFYWRGTVFGTYDNSYVDSNIIFSCGKGITISGGSGHDGIAKSTDGGKTWRGVLDIYSKGTKFYTTSDVIPPFGLQSIAFKDSLTGIAVGQFGKILYTYDGGESWIYESQYHDSLKYIEPSIIHIRYAGSVPIIVTSTGFVFRMKEDNLAPKPEDTITISGRVWEGNKGQPGIPVVLGYRVTMTDSNGYYKFTRVAKGNYVIHAENKYYDGGNPSYYYRPFNYVPERYDFYLSGDTSGIDFNAIDLRTFYSVSGEIITSGGVGLKDIPLTIGDSTTTSTADGKFLFPKIEQKRTYELIPYNKEYKFTPWAFSINIDKDLDTFRFVATPITSVEENEEIKGRIEISPNPAAEYITIDLERCATLSKCGTSTVEIYDVMGILIQLNNLTPALSEGEGARIDISNLAPGVYFVKIGDRVEKFVKMN